MRLGVRRLENPASGIVPENNQLSDFATFVLYIRDYQNCCIDIRKATKCTMDDRTLKYLHKRR